MNARSGYWPGKSEYALSNVPQRFLQKLKDNGKCKVGGLSKLSHRAVDVDVERTLFQMIENSLSLLTQGDSRQYWGRKTNDLIKGSSPVQMLTPFCEPAEN